MTSSITALRAERQTSVFDSRVWSRVLDVMPAELLRGSEAETELERAARLDAAGDIAAELAHEFEFDTALPTEFGRAA
jgi:hypothetical protein